MLNDDTKYQFRSATPSDAALIADHRAVMFREMGEVSAEEAELLRKACLPWITDLMAKGQYCGWFIEHEGKVVAGGGVILMERAPGPGCFRTARAAHVANVYTVPDHRRKGLARRLMRTILEWCGRNSIDVVTLGASDEGRPLYLSLGFEATPHMKLSDERYRAYFKK